MDDDFPQTITARSIDENAAEIRHRGQGSPFSRRMPFTDNGDHLINKTITARDRCPRIRPRVPLPQPRGNLARGGRSVRADIATHQPTRRMAGSVKTSASSRERVENSLTMAPSGPATNQCGVFGRRVY